MTSLWLLLPVKTLALGKSRLAGALTVHQRAVLTAQILERTLALATAGDLFADVLVVSMDPYAHALAAKAGVESLRENTAGLNQSLYEARIHVLARGADAILVLPSDLPLLTDADLTRLVRAAGENPQMVIAPSHDGGTNALLLTPPDIIDFAFGCGSFREHMLAARARGLNPVVIRTPTLAFDVDWPADLHKLDPARSAAARLETR